MTIFFFQSKLYSISLKRIIFQNLSLHFRVDNSYVFFFFLFPCVVWHYIKAAWPINFNCTSHSTGNIYKYQKYTDIHALNFHGQFFFILLKYGPFSPTKYGPFCPICYTLLNINRKKKWWYFYPIKTWFNFSHGNYLSKSVIKF